ncbi:hypothetical protein [Chryseobacterium pennipullorum]|uniref:Uncharacterized protein n=1 Tax=Chryseobacterium pennipullorum TaxID=2258963 RepID=A0A3D9B5Z9_9FLAO|nr:hypothetical protein [Chryseobacterium pennipullorum]REC49120.1 hypothetical protein DRF67_06095 [Chryseobacterium pennipullorum]
MKTVQLTIGLILILFSHFCFSQEKDEIDLDLLRAQASPAANLLGIANSDIEKPTDLKILMVSLREGTGNFSALPTSFAVDIAPFKLNGKYQNLMDSTSFNESFKQSFVVSLGFRGIEKDDELNIGDRSRLGLGAKLSLIRGTFDKDTKTILAKIYDYHIDRQNRIEKLDQDETLIQYHNDKMKLLNEQKTIDNRNSPRYIQLEKEIAILNELETNRISLLVQEHNIKFTELDDQIRKDVQNIKLERYGFFLDMSMGTVLDFRDNTFNNSQITKVGGWLTGGYNWKKQPSTFIFMARYLYNPDSALANPSLEKENLHTLDMGSRLVFKLFDEKFLLSGECLYRSILNTSDFESSWKYLINFEYELAKNQKLTFSFGKDFNGDYQRKGNLIVALNLLVGLGKIKL